MPTGSFSPLPADGGGWRLSKVPWVSGTHLLPWTVTGTSKPGQWLWFANQPAEQPWGLSVFLGQMSLGAEWVSPKGDWLMTSWILSAHVFSLSWIFKTSSGWCVMSHLHLQCLECLVPLDGLCLFSASRNLGISWLSHSILSLSLIPIILFSQDLNKLMDIIHPLCEFIFL